MRPADRPISPCQLSARDRRDDTVSSPTATTRLRGRRGLARIPGCVNLARTRLGTVIHRTADPVPFRTCEHALDCAIGQPAEALHALDSTVQRRGRVRRVVVETRGTHCKLAMKRYAIQRGAYSASLCCSLKSNSKASFLVSQSYCHQGIRVLGSWRKDVRYSRCGA